MTCTYLNDNEVVPVDGAERNPVRVRRGERGLLLRLLLPVELPPVHAPLQGSLPIPPRLDVRPLRRRRLENLGVRVHQTVLYCLRVLIMMEEDMRRVRRTS